MSLRPVSQPLHQQLRDLMLARIESGEWSPGTFLPSETRLAEEYGVAVGTLRKALLDMAAEGLVQRRQGKGTVVSSHDSDAVLFRFFNLRRVDGTTFHPESRVLDRARRTATPEEAAALGLATGADILCITRVRDGDGVPLIYEQIVLDAARFGSLLATPDPLPNTLYQLYQTEFGASVFRALEQVTACAVDADCARELGLAAGTPILRVHRVAVDYNGAPLELRVSYINTGAVHYHAEV
ncbi:MAG: transcriptional regulator of sulfolactate degradation SuyR [Roseibaca calidilacus]|uniref:GntR family transcriptional regulator n=1 Tax=Roseibaca calidilacus TaxID=1666912 RepID=A0A0P7W362_9RHOB|nr:GntR family transcriptional regulator [Roseibaca calidilacus]KPP94534.1 MAG: transcriptional regulator of sulfolactate degradation SuyR [Roseibaca calidilacus]CUX83189.1 GntR family transcriptional regulator [Roseibaca calidilacus]